jgi:hypothetical protein
VQSDVVQARADILLGALEHDGLIVYADAQAGDVMARGYALTDLGHEAYQELGRVLEPA